MPVDPNKQQKSYAYFSDDGNSYVLVLHKNHGVAAGASGTATGVGYPKRWRPRVVHGIGADGIQKATLAIMSVSHPLWVGGASTFTILGDGSFTVTGRTGEKRPRPAPAG